MREFCAMRLPNQLYITVCWMRRRAATGVGRLDHPAATAASSRSSSIAETGAIAAVTWSGWVTASWTENSEIGRRLWNRAGSIGRSHHSCKRMVKAQPRKWLRFGIDHVFQVVDRLANGLLEQRKEQLVLAVEVLVEATQLLRPVDDLLDREVGGALLVDQLEGRIEVSLGALLSA